MLLVTGPQSHRQRKIWQRPELCLVSQGLCRHHIPLPLSLPLAMVTVTVLRLASRLRPQPGHRDLPLSQQLPPQPLGGVTDVGTPAVVIIRMNQAEALPKANFAGQKTFPAFTGRLLTSPLLDAVEGCLLSGSNTDLCICFCG